MYCDQSCIDGIRNIDISDSWACTYSFHGVSMYIDSKQAQRYYWSDVEVTVKPRV